MNIQGGAQKEGTDDGKGEQYRMFQGARVKWPPEVPDDMLETIISETYAALKLYNPDEQGQKIVEHLKKFLDEKYEPYWHVVMGRSFGTHVVHEKLRLLYFYIDKNAFLLYKAGY